MTNRLMWGFIGITALSFIIWVIGPVFSIVDSRPLEPEVNRQISIALLYIAWGLSNVVPRVYNAWLNRKLMGSLKTTPGENGEDRKRLSNEDRVLSERFTEAAEMLKKAHFSRAGNHRWTQRFSRQYLYQLPWYVIIGAPGAGKTTALVNSGFSFRWLTALVKRPDRGIGGTRNCDWWFTNEAVLLDTAGRYTMQQSEEQQDAGEWNNFIGCCANTVASADQWRDLCRNVAASRRFTASAPDELHEQLGIRFPVYVLVTKTDLLKGFRAYFAKFDKAQRDQVWGFTFPWERSKHADFDLLSTFTQEFALLQQRLDAGLPDTLLQESDARARAESYLFPQEFAAARRCFMTTLIRGTQEGLPFDRVMGELSRALQLPDTESGTSGNWNNVNKEAPIPANKGQITAGGNWRNRAVLWSGYLLLAAVLVIAALLLSARRECESAEGGATELQPEAGDLSDLYALLPFLNGVVKSPDSDDLTSTIRRSPGAWGCIAAWSQRCHPGAVAQLITTWLRNDNGSDADYSYEALKAYQMLYQPKHYDGKFLHAWVMLNIQRNQPQNITRAQTKQLEWHLMQLLETQIQASPYARDDALVKREQALINQMPLPVSLASLGGPQSELVFSRKSGKSIGDGIPGLFTPEGYWNSFDKNIEAVTASLHDDDRWVLGGCRWRARINSKLTSRYVNSYMADYMRQWDALLQDIQLNSSADLSQRINTARLLSSNNSPLRKLVINLSHYLVLEKVAAQDDKAQDRKEDGQSSGASSTLEALFPATDSQSAQQTPEQSVTAHFAPIIELAQLLEKADAANSDAAACHAGRLPGALQNMLTSMAVGASSDTQRRDLDNVRKRINVEVGSFCRQAIAGRYPLSRNGRAEVTPDDLARIFFRDNLANKVDTTQANWRFTPGIDGKTLPGGESVLRPFQQAQNIRDAFFANGAATPALSASRHGRRRRSGRWHDRNAGHQRRLALNCFFDRAQQARGAGSLSRQATFNVNGHRVVLEFTLNSIRNPRPRLAGMEIAQCRAISKRRFPDAIWQQWTHWFQSSVLTANKVQQCARLEFYRTADARQPAVSGLRADDFSPQSWAHSQLSMAGEWYQQLGRVLIQAVRESYSATQCLPMRSVRKFLCVIGPVDQPCTLSWRQACELIRSDQPASWTNQTDGYPLYTHIHSGKFTSQLFTMLFDPAAG
ncbi:Fused isobutyryl-CoA mutase [Massospora cicadina]|nr:Fused isobutyryl-CoA mutase [Massospora cicadina]